MGMGGNGNKDVGKMGMGMRYWSGNGNGNGNDSTGMIWNEMRTTKSYSRTALPVHHKARETELVV